MTRSIFALVLLVLVGSCTDGGDSIQYESIPSSLLTPDRVETRLGILAFFDGYPDAATVTYDMNILQSLRSRHTYCVTLNEEEHLDPERVLGRFEYHHPVYTSGRAAAQRRHAELIDADRTSFCGAYWGYGFHEDGVRSALAVARAFGRTL